MTIRIALASPRTAANFDEAMTRVERLVGDAAAQGARIVCFPEAYLPGLRGQDFEVWPFGAAEYEKSLSATSRLARASGIAIVMGVEQPSAEGRRIAAVVVAKDGALAGFQAKTQLDPSEERFYVPGRARRVFDLDGLRFGIAICHEGFRYPETVRWAAVRGAQVVFHPHLTGGDSHGHVPSRWCDPDAPYYERAVVMRALENTIYVASVNYALHHQESATSVVGPDGQCLSALRYGREAVLVQDIDLSAATGKIASRFAPDRCKDEG